MADLIGVVRGVILQDKDIQNLDAGTETGYCHFLPHPIQFSIFLCYLTSSLITQIIRDCNVDDR